LSHDVNQILRARFKFQKICMNMWRLFWAGRNICYLLR